MNYRVVAALLAWCVALASTEAVKAQTAPALPANMVAAPGETKTNSLSSGQRSTLSISTSSSFGSSVNISATDGYGASVSTQLTPSAGQFSSSFGGETGLIQVGVNNNRVETGNAWSAAADGSAISGSKESSAIGDAKVEGIKSAISVELDPAGTVLKASAAPNEATAGTSSATSGFGNANASGGHNMSNSMNVDLQSTSFSNAFSQSF